MRGGGGSTPERGGEGWGCIQLLRGEGRGVEGWRHVKKSISKSVWIG